RVSGAHPHRRQGRRAAGRTHRVRSRGCPGGQGVRLGTVSPRPRKYDLPRNPTFDAHAGQYRYFNPITKKATYFGRDEALAVERAKKANLVVEAQAAKLRQAGGEPATVAYVIRLYRELAVPGKPWDTGYR